MKRISSKLTFVQKWVFPTIWFGILAVSEAISVMQNGIARPVLQIFWPAGMAVLGYFIMRKLVWDIVDEVWDTGDALIVRNKGLEERIALSDIRNVSYSPWARPPWVTLSLRRPTAFGKKVTFWAKPSFIPFRSTPAIRALIQRVEAVQSQ